MTRRNVFSFLLLATLAAQIDGAAAAPAGGAVAPSTGAAVAPATPASAPGATAAAATAKRYPIDRNHSTVGFAAAVLKVSKVTGKFADFSGNVVVLDPKDPTTASIDVKIDAASIDTGIAERDQDLRSPRFFDTAKYPTVTFKSARVRRDGDNYVLDGTFSMHGVAKQISIPFRLLTLDRVVGAEAHFTLNRQDYGIAWERKMEDGSLFVADEVGIDLYLLTRLAEPYVPGTPIPEKDKTKPD
ncbi:MAG TPA: YceI family protein [Thermoanaerobaculia bacterium]|nr:YceI family protein [Thermoanaerobaculia bacterium]